MPRHFLSLPAVLAVGFAATVADAADKNTYLCQSGDLVRRVVVEVGDLGTGLPCEVVYWKDSEAPGVRRVLWNARTDANFCETKAAGLVDKLDTSGWNCDSGSATTAAAASPIQPVAPQPQAVPTPAPAPDAGSLDAAKVGGGAQSFTPATPQPITPAPSAQQQAATPGAGPPLIDTTPQQTQTAAVTPPSAPQPPQPSNQDQSAYAEQLQSVIAENLESLNQSVDGDFQAEIGQFGDLNADGLDDAVVFFNYESSTADSTQFVAAYLFSGDGYHLAATKPVGGSERAVQRVEIENIVNGSIVLRLQLNDASQTEDRRAAMALRDGQLVEIE